MERNIAEKAGILMSAKCKATAFSYYALLYLDLIWDFRTATE